MFDLFYRAGRRQKKKTVMLLKWCLDVLENFMNTIERTGMIISQSCGKISTLVSLIANLLKVKTISLLTFVVQITEINFKYKM